MFAEWQVFQGVQLERHDTKDCYRFITAHKAFDADGAPNAYHPRGIGLDSNANAGYGEVPKKWWADVLVPDPKNPERPYIQETGDFAGYYVAKTALANPSKPATDPARYVDSREVPYFVFPSDFAMLPGTGRLGDIGFAYNLQNRKSCAFIVADIGPKGARLGEMSLALGEALGGNHINPRDGSGAPKGDIVYVIFRNSSSDDAGKRWPLSHAQIENMCQAQLASIGGTDRVLP